MRKISVLLVLIILLSFVSCDSAETGVVINNPVEVAYTTEIGAEQFAAKEYATDKGYNTLEFPTRQAAIVAVESGKAEYVIINDNSATEKFISNTKLEFYEYSQYKVDFCAVFNTDDNAFAQQFNGVVNELKGKGTFSKIDEACRKGEPYIVTGATHYKGKIKVICAPVFDGLLCTDEEGNLTGRDLYYIKEICNALSYEVEFIVCENFEDMFTKLENGEGDLIISPVESTSYREKQYIFSEPYSSLHFGVYKRKYA
ncbi:MAG: transporter substrate-binding domain-containing protein [Clostridia bacterium]|nr:transporter substrate-binding domain-containing protein [Clostridia bacterium]